MNTEHESNMTIPYVKVGDYDFPSFALPLDAGDIGFWGGDAGSSYGNTAPSRSTGWYCPVSYSSTLHCSIRKPLSV